LLQQYRREETAVNGLFLHDRQFIDPGYGMGYRACDPTKSIQVTEGPGGVPNPWHAGTGTLDAVTCPECMETEEFTKLKALLEADLQPIIAELPVVSVPGCDNAYKRLLQLIVSLGKWAFAEHPLELLSVAAARDRASKFLVFTPQTLLFFGYLRLILISFAFNISLAELSFRRINSNLIFILSVISGRSPVFEATHPANESVFVKRLSNSVSIAKLPPGVACSNL